MKELDLRDEADQATPVEDLVPVALDNELPNRVVYNRSLLDARLYKELIQYLKKNWDVFTWCHEDMSGLDP